MPHFEQKLHQRRHFYILSHPQIIASTVFENYRESLLLLLLKSESDLALNNMSKHLHILLSTYQIGLRNDNNSSFQKK